MTSGNPIADADQFAAEDDVRQMWQLPSVKQARARAADLWRLAYGEDVPEEAEPAFEQAMDEYVTNYLFKAAACDPAHPRFVRNFMPPYGWDGCEVPGARMGGDNPDNCYRLAPLAHGRGYVVRLRPVGREPAHVTFTLANNWGTSVTTQSLELSQLVRAEDGSAIITIDEEPASGRPNHLQNTPAVKFLYVRDSLADWAAETPLDLAIEHVRGATQTPFSLEERADRAVFRLLEEVPLYYWFTRLFSGRPVNCLVSPEPVLGMGGLASQCSSMGRFNIAPDEAAVVTYHPAGAAYASFVLYQWWFQSIDAHQRQTSLTSAMSVPNADGSITCVISGRDPRAANWIDTAGYRHLLPLIRWQGLPVGNRPTVDLRIVPFNDLDAILGSSIARFDAEARAQQLSRRSAAWDRRISL
jgi:uncharacterized protein DUF1214